MNEEPREITLHDIVNRITGARALIELMAERVEKTEPDKARVLMSFGQDLWNVWGKYKQLLLPTPTESQ